MVVHYPSSERLGPESTHKQSMRRCYSFSQKCLLLRFSYLTVHHVESSVWLFARVTINRSSHSKTVEKRLIHGIFFDYLKWGEKGGVSLYGWGTAPRRGDRGTPGPCRKIEMKNHLWDSEKVYSCHTSSIFNLICLLHNSFSLLGQQDGGRLATPGSQLLSSWWLLVSLSPHGGQTSQRVYFFAPYVFFTWNAMDRGA